MACRLAARRWASWSSSSAISGETTTVAAGPRQGRPARRSPTCRPRSAARPARRGRRPAPRPRAAARGAAPRSRGGRARAPRSRLRPAGRHRSVTLPTVRSRDGQFSFRPGPNGPGAGAHRRARARAAQRRLAHGRGSQLAAVVMAGAAGLAAGAGGRVAPAQVAGEHAQRHGGAQQPGRRVEKPGHAQELQGERGIMFGRPLRPADVGVDDAYRCRAWRRHGRYGQVGAGGQLPGGADRLGGGPEVPACQVRLPPARLSRSAAACSAATVMPCP